MVRQAPRVTGDLSSCTGEAGALVPTQFALTKRLRYIGLRGERMGRA